MQKTVLVLLILFCCLVFNGANAQLVQLNTQVYFSNSSCLVRLNETFVLNRTRLVGNSYLIPVYYPLQVHVANFSIDSSLALQYFGLVTTSGKKQLLLQFVNTSIEELIRVTITSTMGSLIRTLSPVGNVIIYPLYYTFTNVTAKSNTTNSTTFAIMDIQFIYTSNVTSASTIQMLATTPSLAVLTSTRTSSTVSFFNTPTSFIANMAAITELIVYWPNGNLVLDCRAFGIDTDDYKDYTFVQVLTASAIVAIVSVSIIACGCTTILVIIGIRVMYKGLAQKPKLQLQQATAVVAVAQPEEGDGTEPAQPSVHYV